jgi:hypothetical protein
MENYVAGLPFPLLDPNDPQVAAKVMWNFSYRPQYTDDADIREVEMASNSATSDGPTDPEGAVQASDIALAHSRSRNRRRSKDWAFCATATSTQAKKTTRGLTFPECGECDACPRASYPMCYRRLRRHTVSEGGGAGATFVNNLDPDSAFGFAAKIEDFDYRLLGVRPMLASVHAANVPAKQCQFDNHRSVCPENWEMREIYVIEANAKPLSWHQMIGSDGLLIQKRIFFIDSELWFITASDQYDREGKLWKTIATFNTYRDQPVPDAKVAIFPFKRIFQTALIDEDLQSGYSTVVYMPGHESDDRECWYINMGVITKQWLDPHRMEMIAR